MPITVQVGINDMELPVAFVDRMRSLLGTDYGTFEKALFSKDLPVSIRLNRQKGSVLPYDAETVPWSGGDGYYLSKRPSYTFDPLFHAGAYYVQEAASMFLGEVISRYIHEPVRYLDLCAAPGGKSTHALSALPQGSLLVSNEVIHSRAVILAENIIKWGSPYSVVTNNTAAEWGAFTDFFDVIATDVPCSGEGMFRKDDMSISEWSLSNIARCVERQQAILADVWNALRPGGLLIYSTCTYNVEENESMIDYLVRRFGAQPLTVGTPEKWGISDAFAGTAPVCRFLPHRTRGEGLFMALLRKSGESADNHPSLLDSKDRRTKQRSKKTSVSPEMRLWIDAPDMYEFDADGTTVKAYPKKYAEDMRFISKKLNVLHAGIPLAELKGHNYIPTHALALSTEFNIDVFTQFEVDFDTALSYLRRESVTLSSDLPRGYVVLTYRNFPLGWVKNLGSRANNLYPQDWRIRSSYTPGDITDVGVVRK